MHGMYVESTKTPNRFLVVLGGFAILAFLLGVPLGASLPLVSPLTPDGNGDSGTGDGDGGDGDDGDGNDDNDNGDDGNGNDDKGDNDQGDEGSGNDDNGTDDNGAGSGDASALSVTDAPIEAHKDFAIEVTCTGAFQVDALYAVARSQDNNFNLIYERVRAKGDFGGTGVIFWEIVSSIFDPSDGAESRAPYELLSFMNVDDVAIPGRGVFIVEAFVQSNSDGALSAGIVVESAGSGSCQVAVVP